MAMAYAGHKKREDWKPSQPYIPLRKNITPADTRFEFEFEDDFESIQVIVNPPTPTKTTDRKVAIPMRCIRITNKDIILSSEYIRPTRMTLAEPEKFICLSFAKLNFRDYVNSNKLTSDYICRLLTSGIRLNGIKYEFCGHSNSQLQSRCLYLRTSYKTPMFCCFDGCCLKKRSMDTLINKSGNFESIKDVSKFSKRVALLFTSSILNFTLDPAETKTINDVEKKNKNFTDGCGFMDSNYAQEIVNKMNTNLWSKDNSNASVLQIRYKGFKGILTSVPTSEMQRLEYEDKGAITRFILFILTYLCNKSDTKQGKKVLFRKSMKKFKSSKSSCCSQPNSEETLCILDYSKPYSYGYLNGELITLLATLGIPDSVFLRKLDWHLDLVKDCSVDINTAIEFSIFKNKVHLVKQLKKVKQTNGRSIPADLHAQLGKLEKDEKDSFYKDDKLKCKVKARILVPKSRLLFGVSDPSGKLKPGQCFVKYTDTLLRETDFNHKKVEILSGKVIVGRNPCLHPGDIQLFNAVDIPELDYLVDCIVFSVKGDIPAASTMSGGDLDGDKFFVCWDPELIPLNFYEPEDYSNSECTPKRLNKDKITEEDRINYFAYYNTHLILGHIKSLYLRWVNATPLRAASSQCVELNHLHSKCVDGERVIIPKHLKNYPPPIHPEFILSILERQIMNTFPWATPISPEEQLVELNDWHDAIPDQKEESNDYFGFFLSWICFPLRCITG